MFYVEERKGSVLRAECVAWAFHRVVAGGVAPVTERKVHSQDNDLSDCEVEWYHGM